MYVLPLVVKVHEHVYMVHGSPIIVQDCGVD